MSVESNSLMLEHDSLETIVSASQDIIQSFINSNENVEAHPIIDVATADEALEISQKARPTRHPRPISAVISEAKQIFAHRVRMDHPHFFGFIPSPADPMSFVGDLLTSAANTHAGSWMQSSGPSAVENSLIRFLAATVGLPPSAGGLFVSGGSMANLTALMLARDQKLGDRWEDRARGVAYVSDQTHSSVAKGLRILGFNSGQIRKVKSDSNFRLDVAALEEAVLLDRENGLLPFLVVASCGTTNTGSVDSLRELASFVGRQSPSLWLHVDGAYGASVALSGNHRHLVDGLGEADSISWDAHKWLFQTYGCGMVLVKEEAWLRHSFTVSAEYVRDADDSGQRTSPNYWNYGIELTRPARAMKLWFALQVLGLDCIGRMIDHGFQLAETAENELRKLRNWRIVSRASLAIVNFRFEPEGIAEGELDKMNTAISQHMIKENVAAMLTTQLLGRVVLRICSINPNMPEATMRNVIARLDITANELLQSRSFVRS